MSGTSNQLEIVESLLENQVGQIFENLWILDARKPRLSKKQKQKMRRRIGLPGFFCAEQGMGGSTTSQGPRASRVFTLFISVGIDY